MPPESVTRAPAWLASWRALADTYEDRAHPKASEHALRQELVFCLLGGHGVSFELARSATDVVLALSPFDERWPTAALAGALRAELGAAKFDPRRRDGSLRRYRYPQRKAELIAAAVGWTHQFGPLAERLTGLTCERERRRWLCECPGLGPKSASWLLRNTGFAKDLAILDVHVVRAMREAGRLDNLRLPRDYLALERRFLEWCEEVGASAAALDLFLWEWQRGDISSQTTALPAPRPI
jgi:N-glycosylase/DNA lyase